VQTGDGKKDMWEGWGSHAIQFSPTEKPVGSHGLVSLTHHDTKGKRRNRKLRHESMKKQQKKQWFLLQEEIVGYPPDAIFPFLKLASPGASITCPK